MTRKTEHDKLYVAVHMNDIKTVKKCINSKADLHIRHANESYETPLHCAARWGRTEIAYLLCYAGADLEFRNDEGHTPLHTAIIYMHFEIADLLIKRKAKVNAKDEYNKTPLHYLISPPAVYFESCVRLKELLLANGADIYAKDLEGKSFIEDNKDPDMIEYEVIET